MKTICIEGADFTGKTTLIHALRERLAAMDIKVQVYRQPGGTPLGERMRTFLFSHYSDMDPTTQYAMFTASRTHAANEMALFADTEAVVLMDRYVVSGYVYQRIRPDLLTNARMQAAINRLFGLSLPDHTFFLTCDDDTVRQRASTRHTKDTEVLDRIDVALANKQLYQTLFENYSEIHPDSRAHLLDSTHASTEELVDQVLSAAGFV